MSRDVRDVAVVGGAVSGLAMAHRLDRIDQIEEIRVFERDTYDDNNFVCGEAINDASLVPFEKTPENGFHNDVRGFETRIYDGMERSSGEDPLGTATLSCSDGYVTDRATVEQRWAEELRDRGIDFQTGTAVTTDDFERIQSKYDLVVDATGYPALTHRAKDIDVYTAEMVAIAGEVKGDFSQYVDQPRIIVEGFLGYTWSFPKSEHRANVGIGWAGDDRPDDYVAAFEAAAKRNDIPVPERDRLDIATIPRGPNLAPDQMAFPDEGIYVVGDAAGIANRYQGEGICQAIRSSYLLGDLVERGAAETYPERLYSRMKAEYRLAHIMRGIWVEHEDPDLLAAVTETLEGLTVDDITRNPRTVLKRLLHHPVLTGKVAANPGLLGRIVQAYTDRWEYT